MSRSARLLLEGMILGFGCIFVIEAIDYQLTVSRQEKEARRVARVLIKDLDSKRDATGTYIRTEWPAIMPKDPWGNDIKVTYIKSALMEKIEARSAGRDGLFETRDDIIEYGGAFNFNGIREAVKEDIGEISNKKAKGMVKGAIEGLREGLKNKN